MCNCRGLVLIFLILLFICLVVFLFPQRDCNFLHFLTDTSAPRRPAELLCSKPQKCRFTTLCDTEVASLACPEFLYSVLKRTWDLALNWPFSGMDLKAKTAKTWKPWLFVGLMESFVPLLLPLEKGDVEPPKLPVQTLHGFHEVNGWKEEWGLCWVCSSPVLVIDLSMILSKTTVSLVLAASLGVEQQMAII